ncbi:phosphotransferase family protein [Microbacterium sp. ASV49]|uniref:Phosphotransferase family protein n=1 Tax=Microbacterium candidum TaxID=3041922 RepID=A0ABT7MVH6_9MICO|nr:phosphotransferase family protein [Microbacterium sp. ASV49]MDL9978462.1 phosphotransferase family protein [Microbacterium sp. ASV49]
MAEPVPGLDLDRFGAWLVSAVPGAGGEVTASVIAGGKSNLTYDVTDGTSRWIVRRPPLGHVLATAHDMGREYRVMSALQGSAVPVPHMFAFCDDPEVIGAPFYVMERIDGTAFTRAAQLEALGADRTRTISTRMVDTMADLHAVVPDAVGLGDFGRPEGFLGRQVERWKKQLDSSHTRDLPAADELYRRLSADVPPDGAVGIVHGDFRLDNVLVDAADRPAAVIDWEMATLGDPLTDLALMLVYGRMAAAAGAIVADANLAPGFLTEAEIVERYASRSDRDLSRFGFYLGLAAFKLTGILEGIHYRYQHGQTVGPGFDRIGDLVDPLLQAGLDALD